MNLSKVLKQKRDAEDRLRNKSPVTVFTESVAGKQSFKSTEDFALKNHNHDLVYSKVGHNHDSVYMKLGQKVETKYFELLIGNLEFLYSTDGDILMGEVI